MLILRETRFPEIPKTTQKLKSTRFSRVPYNTRQILIIALFYSFRARAIAFVIAFVTMKN